MKKELAILEFIKILEDTLICVSDNRVKIALQGGIKLAKSVLVNGHVDKNLYSVLYRYCNDSLPWDYGLGDAWERMDRIVRRLHNWGL